MSKETDELIRHFGGLSSGTVGDAIIEYLGSSDCSPKTRERIWVELERLDAIMQERFEQTLKTPDLFGQNVEATQGRRPLSLPSCSASWPRGFSVTIGSRWQTKQTPRLRGVLFAADVTENSVSLQLEETEDFRGGLASKLAWVSTAQDLAEKWECLPNKQIQESLKTDADANPS